MGAVRRWMHKLLTVCALVAAQGSARTMSSGAAFGLSEATLQYLNTKQPQAPTPSFNLLTNVTLPSPGQSAEFFTAGCFDREDPADDSQFYLQPRFGYHIDDAAIADLTEHYAKWLLPLQAEAHLDVCSSWVSCCPSIHTGSSTATRVAVFAEAVVSAVVWQL